MSRDSQLPASSWFGQLNFRKVPANAMWFTAIVAAIFHLVGKIAMAEIVIAGVSGLAAYGTYVMVVGLFVYVTGEDPLNGIWAIVPKTQSCPGRWER